MPLGLLPFVQARILARTLRGDMEGYLPTSRSDGVSA
jgi:CRISP-associated protein Cas1